MHQLFKSLIHSCCDYWEFGYEHLDNSIDEVILPESIQKIIDDILATKPIILTNSEIINYLDTNPRFSSWNINEQYGTCNLIHYAMNKITY
jgi:hypothetical protein